LAESKRLPGKGDKAAPSDLNSDAKSSCASKESGTRSSRGFSRASSVAISLCPTAVTENSPVDMSADANAKSAPDRPSAVSRLEDRASSSASSVKVPGVTSRTTSRRTTDLAPRLRASAGSSTCSHTATRWPLRMSFSR
jgi:hypothetical protein